MTFSNPIVGGTTLIRPAIHSPDYVVGTAGWSINKDGTAEFNNAVIRGLLESANYVSGVSGWKLDQLGTAEFNSVTIRGTGTAQPIIIGASNQPQVTLGTSSDVGFIRFPTNRPVESAAANVLAGAVNPGAANESATLQLHGPTVTGATQQATILVNSQANDGSTKASIDLATGTTSIAYNDDSFFINGPRVVATPNASTSSALFVNANAGQTGNLFRVQKNSVDAFSVDASSVMRAANRVVGTVSITPTAVNVPTSVTVTFPTPLTGTSFNCQVSAATANPGTQVTGVSYTAVSSTGVTLWLTRSNAGLNTTTVSYTVEGF